MDIKDKVTPILDLLGNTMQVCVCVCKRQQSETEQEHEIVHTIYLKLQEVKLFFFAGRHLYVPTTCTLSPG